MGFTKENRCAKISRELRKLNSADLSTACYVKGGGSVNSLCVKGAIASYVTALICGSDNKAIFVQRRSFATGALVADDVLNVFHVRSCRKVNF